MLVLRDAISLKCNISQNQWEFCPHKSTATALASTVHGWTSSLHDGNDVGTVFFDLKKAFDSVFAAKIALPSNLVAQLAE